MTVDQLRQFRQSWTDSPLYATKNLERTRAFFRFCHQAGWMKENPAKAVKPPKVTQTPTLPFSRDEMKRIAKACDEYGGNKKRIKAFVLTMRYTGLRIGDAIRLSRSQVADGRVFVRTAKTGQPVTVPVPPEVVKALGQVENGADRYFWTGKNIRSAVSNWSRYLARVFELAEVEGCTFASLPRYVCRRTSAGRRIRRGRREHPWKHSSSGGQTLCALGARAPRTP